MPISIFCCPREGLLGVSFKFSFRTGRSLSGLGKRMMTASFHSDENILSPKMPFMSLTGYLMVSFRFMRARFVDHHRRRGERGYSSTTCGI